jgi:hypothetical protein
MNLYVGGDSFCFYRDNADSDWPLILANKLGLLLQGQGFPGSSWWLTRKNLKDFLDSKEYTTNDIFVICHTDYSRPPIDYFPKVDMTLSREEINRLWLTHFFSQEFSDWILTNWYSELNTWLCNHFVLHLNCFDYEKKFANKLRGIVYENSLVNISRQEVDKSSDMMYDARRNHFSTEKNQWIANELATIINGTVHTAD